MSGIKYGLEFSFGKVFDSCGLENNDGKLKSVTLSLVYKHKYLYSKICHQAWFLFTHESTTKRNSLSITSTKRET